MNEKKETFVVWDVVWLKQTMSFGIYWAVNKVKLIRCAKMCVDRDIFHELFVFFRNLHVSNNPQVCFSHLSKHFTDWKCIVINSQMPFYNQSRRERERVWARNVFVELKMISLNDSWTFSPFDSLAVLIVFVWCHIRCKFHHNSEDNGILHSIHWYNFISTELIHFQANYNINQSNSQCVRAVYAIIWSVWRTTSYNINGSINKMIFFTGIVKSRNRFRWYGSGRNEVFWRNIFSCIVFLIISLNPV